MDQVELIHLLDQLRREPKETEWLEFKGSYHEPQMIGEYISALANSACIRHRPKGYLVFGIDDATHAVTGTDFDPYKERAKGNQALLMWLVSLLHPNLGFHPHCFWSSGKRVVLFEIAPALDIPVRFSGVAYVRYGEHKTELFKHPELERQIWLRRGQKDWSAQICSTASLKDLEPEAIRRAREEYVKKFPLYAESARDWDDGAFLNKTKLTVDGRITNAAILLLGRPESAPLLSPAAAQVSWFLWDKDKNPLDYEHFGPPFLLNVDRVFSKIRNLTYRYLPDGTLFPNETAQYDPWVIREALHNCIAHQDYALQGRIDVVESPTSLLFSNMGSFIPGTIQAVVERDAPQEVYRNRFLAEAMVTLNMIDAQGGGIKKMFQTQMRRFFPLPDYELQPERVVARIRGEILDEEYTKLLMQRTDIDLWTAILLDKVQKRVLISKEEHKDLKSQDVVEGRYPNLFVSSQVAIAVGDKAGYVRNRGFDKKYYQDLIVDLLRLGPASRGEIDDLLRPKLPDIMTVEQKKDRIHNLLSDLFHKQRRIKNIGSRSFSRWVLVNENAMSSKKRKNKEKQTKLKQS